jgi:hypothetical protein
MTAARGARFRIADLHKIEPIPSGQIPRHGHGLADK